jgi:hypothetical protein
MVMSSQAKWTRSHDVDFPSGHDELCRWLLTLDMPTCVSASPSHFHAIVSDWVDVNHHAERKAFSLGPISSKDGTIEVEIRTFSTRAADSIQESFTNAQFIRVGSNRANDSSLALIESASFVDLVDRSKADAMIDVRFVTPTVFRTGSKTSVLPGATQVFAHARRVWSEWAPRDLAPHLEFGTLSILTPFLEGTTTRWDLGRRHWSGFVGRAQYDLSLLDARDVRVLNVMGSLLDFVGVGSNTTWGMGVVSVSTGNSPISATSPRISRSKRRKS